MAEIELLAVVALLEDIPERGLGTVVERLAPEVYEVEFSDDAGKTYAFLALRAGQLMRLRHEPAPQAGRVRAPQVSTDHLRGRRVPFPVSCYNRAR